MTLISDLFTDDRVAGAAPLVANPLTTEDALVEAQLLGVRFDAWVGTAALLFELRMCEQFPLSNTGLFVARGVRDLRWSAPELLTRRRAWTVDASVVRANVDSTDLALDLWGARLTVVSKTAEFFAVNVSGIDGRPPDYGEGKDREVLEQLATWDSPIDVVGADCLPCHGTNTA